jgi:mannosyltransferase OCH1-like enzyme
MIPKTLFSIWIGDKPIPDICKLCIETHKKLKGYAHTLITNENMYTGSDYIRQCIESKSWVKAADYLRIYYIYTYGGIYIDADAEILKDKNFDSLLTFDLFVCRELNMHLSNAVIGAIKNNSILKIILDTMDLEFRGDDGNIWDPGMLLFTQTIYNESTKHKNIIFLTSDYFIPYDHISNTLNITENTIVYHHFLKSHVKIIQ